MAGEAQAGATLFHGHGTRSVRVASLLRGLGVAYREVLVPFLRRLLQPDSLVSIPQARCPPSMALRG